MSEPRIPLHSKYRPDIDGLRAIAVAAVVAFHAAPRLAPGGFVGVDVFFVISGFLITGVIAAELEDGKFTVRRFYARRVRRIFPALAVMLGAAALVAWAFLLPDEWRRFGKHLFAGGAFVSNLALMREGGYFAWASESTPLLHLWSLGVEEQFYFFWPLLLLLLWRVSRPTRMALLAAVVVSSFALNLLTIGRYPAYTFYLPFTRLWELGLGSLLALWRPGRPMSRRTMESASVIGALLLAASIVITRENSFPGAWALLPTAGTVMIIGAGPRASINRLALAARPLVFVGLISYPLYLWHWPIFSFLRIGHGAIDPEATLMVVILSVLLAWGTYRWVETPIRTRRSTSLPLYAVSALLAAIAGIGLAAAAGRIEPRLASPTITTQLAATGDWSYPFGENFGRTDGFTVSTVKGALPHAVLFIGDSHLEQYWPRIEFAAARRPSPELRFVTNGGCPPVPGIAVRRGDVCARYLEFAFAAADDPAVTSVVFGAYWSGYIDGDASAEEADASLAGLGEEIRRLVRLRKRVYVILSSPAAPQLDPRRMISRRDGTIETKPLAVRDFLASAGTANDAVRRTAIAAGAEVIDPLPFLCPAGICPAVSIDGRPLYRDASHMRPFHVRERASFVDRVLR